MPSKAAFIFLTICFIAIIGSGNSLTCNGDCNDTKPDCINGMYSLVCPSDMTNCVSKRNGKNFILGCMSDKSVRTRCKLPKCSSCKTPNCNKGF